MKEFRLNGRSYTCIYGESGKLYIDSKPQNEFFGSLSSIDKYTLDVAENRFRQPGNTLNRQQILDKLYEESLVKAR